MEGRGNLEFVAPFPVPGSRRSYGRVRHIAHIPKCQFRTPVSEALTMSNFFFAAEARTPSRPVRFPGVGWIPDAVLFCSRIRAGPISNDKSRSIYEFRDDRWPYPSAFRGSYRR